MAKTQAKLTTAPEALGIGQPIIHTDGRDAARLANWVFGRRRQSHIALTTDNDGWGTNGVGTLRAVLTGSTQTFIDTDCLCDVDAGEHTWKFSAEVSALAVGDTATVTLTIDGSLGTVTQTLNFTSADTTERRTSGFTISSAVDVEAGEWWRVQISGSKTGGAAVIIELELEEDEMTSSLPDPEDN